MNDRREFLRRGLSALGLGLAGGSAFGTLRRPFGFSPPPPPPGAAGDPVRLIPPNPASTVIDGLPFEPWFTADDWVDPQTIPFHLSYQGPIPTATEEVEVAIVGGGLSGLTTAYLLRRFRPVVFDLRPRFGGNAQGERWLGTRSSLGSAYVITPDPGTFLFRLYHQLGLHQVKEVSFPPDPMQVGGQVVPGYWSGQGMSPAEQYAFQRYAEVVSYMANEAYPEIPLPEDPVAAAFVRDLDEMDFRQDLEQRMGVPLTPFLAAGVQSYCYSSFGVGMDEISAASGWNFVAAEEFGRWVFPGGNSYIARKLWQRLRQRESQGPPNQPPMLRPDCQVVDVRRVGKRVQVTWLDGTGTAQALLARYVVMAGSKHVAKHVLHDLSTLDPQKHEAMQAIETVAYLVANVLLHTHVPNGFYDIFMIGDANFPMTPGAFEQAPRPVDVLNGSYAGPPNAPRGSLTLYWPLPWQSARFSLMLGEPYRTYGELLAPRVREALQLLGLPESAIEQIRVSRWGHAMPIARPRIIADGIAEELLRPFQERIYFVNQDNWALPAVENSLLDAGAVAREIKGLLNA